MICLMKTCLKFVGKSSSSSFNCLGMFFAEADAKKQICLGKSLGICQLLRQILNAVNDGDIITNPYDIANTFNNYFASLAETAKKA